MLHMIYNPAAGTGRGQKTGIQLEEALQKRGLPFRSLATQAPGHATVLAREAAAAGAETVLAVGGDGTALEVARGLMGTETALGILPAGTGNDFRKTLGLDGDPMKALDAVLQAAPQPIDAGLVNGQLFLNEIGTGFDVAVLDYAAKAKKWCKGLLPYLLGVLRALFTFRPIHVKLQIDDQPPEERDVFVVAAANGGIIGGGIVIAPDARVDDGLLDIVVVDRIKWYKLPLRLVGLLKGKILTFPETHFIRGKTLTFSAPGMRLNVDGEIVSLSEARVSVMPGAINILR